jgi:hypothetical protein
MADTIHSILFAYPAFTGFVLAMIVLALVIRVLRWLDARPRTEPSEIDGLHSAPENLEKRARRAF